MSELKGKVAVITGASAGSTSSWPTRAWARMGRFSSSVEEMIDVNLKGTTYSVRAALPHLLECGGGDEL